VGDVEILEKKIEGNQGYITARVNSPAFGFVVPFGYTASANVRYKYDPTNYTNKPRYNSTFVPIYDVEPIPQDFHEQAALARFYYHTEPITATVIDVLTQFSISDIENVCKDKKVKEFYDAIYDTSNLKEIIKAVFFEYYVSANVWSYRYGPGDYVISPKGVSVPAYKWNILNPAKVNVKGSLFFDQQETTLTLDDEIREAIMRDTEEGRRFLRSLPDDIRRSINKQDGSITLDPERVYHIARNKMPFQRYAVPFIMRNIGPLRVKQKLMEMDLSTADGVINQLVTVTCGNDEHPATTEQLEALAELLQTPSKAYALVWDHTLKLQFHKPEAQFFDPKKYEQVNRDIAAGYGIAKSVISDNGTYASQNVSVKSLIRWLEWGREDVKRWLEREYRIIAEENNLSTYPTIRFKKVSLQEEKDIKNILFQMHDRGMISSETVVKEAGYDFEVEKDRLREEKTIREKEGILVPGSPYQQPGRPAGRPDGAEDSEPRTRDDEPEPHGASVYSIFKANKEDKIEDYTEELLELYNSFAEKIAEMAQDEDDLETILLAILILRDEMKSVSNAYITDTFIDEYTKLIDGDYTDDPIALEYLTKVLKWNDFYVSRLVTDIQNDIKVSTGNGLDVSQAVKDAFDTNRYRIPMFGNEDIRKAEFYGTSAGQKAIGNTHGYWICTFRNSCEVCIDRHGNSYSIEELLDMYPAHNWCECLISFYKKT